MMRHFPEFSYFCGNMSALFHMKLLRSALALVLLVSSCLVSYAENGREYMLTRIDDGAGLSHSAVLSIYQDRTGLMWFGTYDGLNCYDGREMTIFRSDTGDEHSLSNNVIQSVSQADGNCLWVENYLCLNRFSCESMTVTDTCRFQGDYAVHSNVKGDTWLMYRDSLFYYNTIHGRFIGLGQHFRQEAATKDRFYVTESGALWFFPEDSGKISIYELSSFSSDSASVKLTVSTANFHWNPVREMFPQKDVICFVDSEDDLYMYDISNRSKVYLRNIGTLKSRYGDIIGIVPFYEDIFIGFKINGLVRLCASRRYSDEVVDRNMRIFAMYKDSEQSILWVGTDGWGAISYAFSVPIATNLMSMDLSPNLSRPIRSIMTDDDGSLWYGTKGDGLVRIRDYRHALPFQDYSDVEVFSSSGKSSAESYVRSREEFQIYDLEKSRYHDGFWMGTGKGIYFFSNDGERISKVFDKDGSLDTEVHSVIESGPDELYIATSGEGFWKIGISGREGDFRVEDYRRYSFYDKGHSLDVFYQMIQEGDSLLWLGSRGNGLVRFETKSEEYRVISLQDALGKAVDDILSLCRASDGRIYVGTTSGMVAFTFDDGHLEASYIGKEAGLFNDMIHGIVEDTKGVLWLSTNKGLTKYCLATGATHTYYYTSGLSVGEFSDDAYYESADGEIFFGGVNGLVWLKPDTEVTSGLDRKVLLRKMSIGGDYVNIYDYIRKKGDKKEIVLAGNDISFSVSFAVPDFLNSADIEYSYILEGYSTSWSEYSGINEASFQSVPSGEYILRVKSKKDVSDSGYTMLSIPVIIRKPWYVSSFAIVVYVLLLLALMSYWVYWAIQVRKQYLAQEAVDQLKSVSDYWQSIDDRFAVIYQCVDKLKRESAGCVEMLDTLDIIKETISGVLSSRPVQTSVCPDKYVIATTERIGGISNEVISALETAGTDIGKIHVDIPKDMVCPVYVNALRRVLYACYECLASVDTYVSAIVERDVLVFRFKAGNNDIVGAQRRLDSAFGRMFVHIKAGSSLLQTEEGSVLEISFSLPRVLPHEDRPGKTVVLLGASPDFGWLVSDMLAADWTVFPCRDIDEVTARLEKGPVALLMVDMSRYAGREKEFVDVLYSRKHLLSSVPFVPMFTEMTDVDACKALILVSDAYMLLPHDILMLKNVVHKAVYGKGNIGSIQVEEIAALGGHLLCGDARDMEFVEKVISVIDSCLDKEDLGTQMIADRMAMSQSQLYRRFRKLFRMSPERLIKHYRIEKAARLLKDERISISDVIADVGISSRSYFYKEFSARFGMTPREYREKFCSKQSSSLANN